MSIWDQIKQTFGAKPANVQAAEVEAVEPVKMPDRVSLSPLPESIRGMEKRRNIDRLGMMRAKHIGFGPTFGPAQEGFWEYKEQRTGGHSKADYLGRHRTEN